MSFQPAAGHDRLKAKCTEASGGTTGCRNGRVTREEAADLLDAQGFKLSAPEGAAAFLTQHPAFRMVARTAPEVAAVAKVNHLRFVAH